MDALLLAPLRSSCGVRGLELLLEGCRWRLRRLPQKCRTEGSAGRPIRPSIHPSIHAFHPFHSIPSHAPSRPSSVSSEVFGVCSLVAFRLGVRPLEQSTIQFASRQLKHPCVAAGTAELQAAQERQPRLAPLPPILHMRAQANPFSV